MNLILIVRGGVPNEVLHFDYGSKASEAYQDICEALELDPENPHTDDLDVYFYSGIGVMDGVNMKQYLGLEEDRTT